MGPPTVHVGGSQSNVAWLKDPPTQASTDRKDSQALIGMQPRPPVVNFQHVASLHQW